jgi:hypothetical protein
MAGLDNIKPSANAGMQKTFLRNFVLIILLLPQTQPVDTASRPAPRQQPPVYSSEPAKISKIFHTFLEPRMPVRHSPQPNNRVISDSFLLLMGFCARLIIFNQNFPSVSSDF